MSLGTQQGKENSRMYNEMVIIKLIQSMSNMLVSPPEVWKDHIHQHFKKKGLGFYDRVKKWMMISNEANDNNLKISPVDDEGTSACGKIDLRLI